MNPTTNPSARVSDWLAPLRDFLDGVANDLGTHESDAEVRTQFDGSGPTSSPGVYTAEVARVISHVVCGRADHWGGLQYCHSFVVADQSKGKVSTDAFQLCTFARDAMIDTIESAVRNSEMPDLRTIEQSANVVLLAGGFAETAGCDLSVIRSPEKDGEVTIASLALSYLDAEQAIIIRSTVVCVPEWRCIGMATPLQRKLIVLDDLRNRHSARSTSQR